MKDIHETKFSGIFRAHILFINHFMNPLKLSLNSKMFFVLVTIATSTNYNKRQRKKWKELSFITFVFVFVVNIMDFCFDERDHYKHFCINIMAISFLISQYDQKLFSLIGKKDVFDVWNLKHDISLSNLQVYLSFSGIGTKIPYHDR